MTPNNTTKKGKNSNFSEEHVAHIYITKVISLNKSLLWVRVRRKILKNKSYRKLMARHKRIRQDREAQTID